jgi:hypothetical protein
LESAPNVTVRGLLQDPKQKSQRTSTEDGLQTDFSKGQSEKAERPMDRRLELAANVTVRRPQQDTKQESQRTSTEDGIQTDLNESHSAKAERPIDRRLEFNSNATVFSLSFPAEQESRSSSTEDGIRIESGDPITQTSDLTSKSTKNPFTTLNETEPSSISIDLIPLSTNTIPWIVVTEAGIQNRFNDRQPQNASCSIVASRDGESKTTDCRDWQK